MASLAGFGLSIVLGVIVLALVVVGVVSRHHRVMALVAAVTMLAGAVAGSQLLLVATTRA